jgi:hypothetical protein
MANCKHETLETQLPNLQLPNNQIPLPETVAEWCKVRSHRNSDTDSELSEMSNDTNSDSILSISDEDEDSYQADQSRLLTTPESSHGDKETHSKTFWIRNRPYLLAGITGALVYLGYLVKTNHLLIGWFPPK